MNAESTGKKSKPNTDWERFSHKSDQEIDAGIAADPDARQTDAKFWEKARVVMPKNKETITIRLDADLLQWFRETKGYQTRINAILRSYMEAQRH